MPGKTKAMGKRMPGRATEAPVAARAFDARPWLLGAGLALAAIAAYWRVLGNGFVDFDDDIYVLNNVHVKSGFTFDGLRWAFGSATNGNWHPVTWISHMLDVQWFGLDPAAHHMVSVLWHAASAVLLLIVLWRMTGRLWRSAFVAALFALHPLRVESVAWAAERKDVLSGFFYLCTLAAYAWYVRRPRSWQRYAAVAAMLALALMSKPAAVTAPFLLLLLDYWPLERKERPLFLLKEKIPLFALAAAVSVVTYIAQGQIGAMDIENVAFPARAANAAVSYARYLGKIFWPHPLAALYPYTTDLPAAAVAASCLLLAAITAAALYFGRKRRYLPVGWFWFLGTLVPTIGIVQVGWQAYADRYTYIPCIGIFIALVWLAADAIEARKWRLAGPMAAAAILPALAIATWSQLPYWHDDIALFQHVLASTPENPAAEFHIGKDFADAGRYAEAMPHLEKMIRLRPKYYAAYYVLGQAQMGLEDADSAVRSFSEALRIDPYYAVAYYARATLLVKSEKYDAAEADLRAALEWGLSAEQQPEAYNALGVILAQRGDLQGAYAECETAIWLDPGMVEAQRNLARILIAEDRTQEAIHQLEQALVTTHGDASIRELLDTVEGRR
jgi:tetratricopeptide (TPR) repeat protein